VIYAFIRANVGKDRIASLVAITMQVLANTKIAALPSPATIQRMQTEIGVLNRIQLYDALTKDAKANTIFAHDGTTDHGHKIGVGVIHIDRSKTAAPKQSKKVKYQPPKQQTRESLTLFAREQPDGTAKSGMQLLNDAITDVNAAGSAAIKGRPPFTIDRIRGTISDHNITEQAENKLVKAAHTDANANALGWIECFCWNHK
jgi:hypothetical protein